jgi:hypothetical protein
MGEWELENRDRRTRHPDDARSKFERWVLEYGGSLAVSKALGVHHITVASWIGRRGRPNIETAAKILKLAGKDLSIDDIIEGTRTSYP